MNPKYKVVATWGAQEYTTELGEFSTLEEAMDRVNAWHDAPEVKGMKIDLLEVIKVTNVTVWSEQPATVDYERVGVPPSTGRFEGIRTKEISPAFAGTRTQPSEQVRDTFQPFDDLQETVWNLEDRHVGLRQELGGDIDHVYEHINELREQLVSNTEDLDNLESASSTLRDDVLAYKEVTEELDAAMRHEVAGLRREMESLRGRTVLRQPVIRRHEDWEPAIQRHEEWERQQQKNKEVSER